jgi:hypothetical protein
VGKLDERAVEGQRGKRNNKKKNHALKGRTEHLVALAGNYLWAA